MQNSQDVIDVCWDRTLSISKMALSLSLALLAVKLKAISSFKMQVNTRPVTRRHMPNKVKFKQTRHDSLEPLTVTVDVDTEFPYREMHIVR